MRFRLLFILLLFSISVRAQDPIEIMNSLEKAGLLSKLEKDRAVNELKHAEEQRKKYAEHTLVYVEKRDWNFYPLQLLTTAKMFSASGTSNGFSFIATEVEIKKGQEAIYIRKLSAFAEKVLAAGLISEKTYQEAIEKIKKLDLRSDFEVASFLTDRSETEYYLQPRHYKKFADSLLAKELVTQGDYGIILQKLETKQFRHYSDVYPYLKNFLAIDLKTLPAEPITFLEAIHRKASETLKETTYDSFNVKIIKNKKETFKDFTVYDALVTLTKNGVKYSHKSFYNADYSEKEKDDDQYPVDPQSFHRVFNKMLVDQGAQYRLHIVQMDDYRIGLLPLTKQQFENLMWSYTGMRKGRYIQLSYEDFSPKITRRALVDAFGTYDSIGLLKNYTAAQKDSALQEAQAGDINHYSEILSAFPNLVFEIDLEYGVNKGMYKDLTKQIASISRGYFNPTNIIDGYDYKKRKSTFLYGFSLNGKVYRTRLKQEDDWLDTTFWDLIEKAVSEQDKNGRFHLVYPNDGMRYVYLTNAQYLHLKERKLLEFEEVQDEE